jgi:hypothetical protein
LGIDIWRLIPRGLGGKRGGSAIAHHFFDTDTDQHTQGLFDSHDQAAVEDAGGDYAESEIYDDLGGDSLGDGFDEIGMDRGG